MPVTFPLVMRNVRIIVTLKMLLLFALFSLGNVYAETYSRGESNDINAQQSVVRGRVTEAATDQPLPGVSIYIKGTTIGTTTNIDGEYTLSNVPTDAILVYTFIGMRSQEIAVGDRSEINISLEAETIGIDEVVAVGYGTMRQRDIVGSVSVVDSRALENRPIANLGQGLQGVIPNLNITLADGAPGSGATFNIRGFTGIAGGEPLILVDGVEMDPNLLNPNDIEQISVLKDASAAAVYGARAAFGVVLITTKSAKEETKPIFELSTNYSMNRPTQYPNLINSLEWVEFLREKARNLGNAEPFTEEYIQRLNAHLEDPKNNPAAYINPNNPARYIYVGSTDWFDEAFEKFNPTSQTTLSVRGGGSNLSYFVHAGALNQDGILKFGNDSYDRYNLRTRLTYDITPWLQLNFNNIFTRTEQDAVFHYPGVGNVWHDLTRKPITHPIFNPDGTYAESAIALLAEGGRDITYGSDFRTTIGGEIRPFEGLTIIGSYTYNVFDQNRKRHKKEVERFSGPKDMAVAETIHTTPTELRIDFAGSVYQTTNIYANYDKTFNDIHYFDATLGYNFEERRTNSSFSRNINLVTDELPSLNLTTGTPSIDETINSWALEGYFYRLNYILNEKYLVNFSGRYDATSRFAEEDRWGFFPSFALGWRISNEPFFDPIREVMNYFQIRASYGELGNQVTSSFFPYMPTLDPFRPSAILAGDRPLSVRSPLLVSSTLTWETAISRNVGFDAAMFDNRMQYSFDYFEREVVNQLGPGMAVPATLGAAAPQANAVESITWGWEFEWSWRDRIGNTGYNFGFNIADWQAEITSYNNPTKSFAAAYYEGQRIGEIWGFETNGLFESSEQYLASGLDYSNLTSLPIAGGDVYYVDQNGDGKIDAGLLTVDNPGDRVIIGNNSPRYTYGINLGASWKSLSVDVFMQGVLKRDILLGGGLFWPNESATISKHHLDYWTEDNKDAYWPRVLGNQGGFNYHASDRYLQDFSYLRMKQVNISYRLPRSWIESINIQDAHIYFSGHNLFEFHNVIDNFDPDISTGGQGGWGSGKSYPFGRALSMGINLSF